MAASIFEEMRAGITGRVRDDLDPDRTAFATMFPHPVTSPRAPIGQLSLSAGPLGSACPVRPAGDHGWS
ncbi:hypothetical protein [Streptomyces tsukubensis]|uniref:Uncharacterized protein n=1 Tax=Streptomyces tsukubensis TaxID=83656 RepID=A0A1V4ABC8_9ACTN|nr:hypothetical protein [Streptomyces tsukubensis]OON80826.1 hypothetical protein B1H18_10555 [Streptomyces tsukubensis]QFR93533.1 hypothetical protein GBW32_11110 [Streptomyces tsukubensis]